MTDLKSLVTRSVCGAILLTGVAFSTTLAGTSSARATTYTGGAGTQTDPDWSVTVGAGITLVEDILYTGSTTPAGPANQGYTTGSGHLLDWIVNTAGFTNAGLVTNGQITGMSFTDTDADLFGVHFGCGSTGDCELVWLFSGDTTFTVNSLNGFSNISAFSDVATTPLPAAFPLFAGGLGLLGMFARRKKRTTSVLAA
jgi:PEP-CTERM motif-containing protein